MARRKAEVPATEGEPVRFSLNKVARGWFGDAASARMRVEDGVLVVLPSKRTKGLANLPPTDKMIDITASDAGVRFTALMPKAIEKGTTFVLQQENYGWLRFKPLEAGATAAKEDGVAKVVG